MTTRVLILGSTGSIGTQALDVIARHRDRFEVAGLAAGGARAGLLAQQAAEFHVSRTATGADGMAGVLDLIRETEADVVLNAMVGAVGLAPTVEALKTGARLALANKESLIAGGPVVMELAKPGQLVPVDSEHSALAQCLRSGTGQEVASLVLTASGGPFRGFSREQLDAVTPEQAGKHPTWSMGPMNTLNSASLVNKGLELLEAHYLFGLHCDQIEVTVHPQSVVHSMVSFVDGSTIAQASPPDMRLPIALALSWPDRLSDVIRPVDFSKAHTWTFEPVDDAAFPAVRLAREAGKGGGSLPSVYNAANEEAAAAFLAEKLRFPQIAEVIEEVLSRGSQWAVKPGTLEEALEADRWARGEARRVLVKKE
ncbi:1-deoxy-D-xylulose-5-phosphate reductoisomerase [Segniliparus rugosus]|uniref:1-deoxy-D-xylulose 5-phosphate reductoisomerase n=1 Tax=Segniliparus rugosus (strain ATCC BAA-974 / DSM 45345 / CCUG 50838 / CIP 108380 / JCM 13579 / CDC 945) TaxID=679197 RepID=E5XL46_SEGRC|nr:1-deoxy-D-xylulose-5-phosphate reductoisomerase [Segniliparus rugosus]EFV14914.1 1-deoxy-D-xylulose 5-phosphate reductoisomerase [Segniliparus rugosus ATCC BAA-974]